MRKSVRRVVISVVVALALLIALAAGAGWWWVSGSIPSLDAEWRLPGLQGPVEIVTDRHGVPQRLRARRRPTRGSWPAPCTRATACGRWSSIAAPRYGRLAEVLGEAALPIDRRMLTLRIRAAAAAEWPRLGPSARAALQRYAEGVNAATAGMDRPPAAAGVPASGLHARSLDARGLAGHRAAARLPAGREPGRRAAAPRPGPRRRRRSKRDRLAGRLSRRRADRARRHRPAAAGDPRGAGGHDVCRARPDATVVSPRACHPAAPARRPGLARPGCAAWQQQRLGGVGPADGHRPPDPGQRPAPAHRAALGVVRGAPGGRRPRRAGRVGAWHALRRHRPQRPHRLGLHQHRRRRAGLRRRAGRHRRPPRPGRQGLGTGGGGRRARFRSAGGPSRRRSRSGAPVRGRLRRREPRVGDAAGMAVARCAAPGGAARAGAQVVGVRRRVR